MADPDARSLRILYEPSCQDLRKTTRLRLCFGCAVHRVCLGKNHTCSKFTSVADVPMQGAVADTYGSFLGSMCFLECNMNQVRANSTRLSTGRILGALGMAPYEVLVQATISDLYFVHQRGTRIAVWNLFLLCGICGAGFISGYIIEDLGYKWTFGVCAILFGIFGIGILFFVPETNYIRNDVTSKILAKTGIQHQERGAEDEKFYEKGMHVEAHSIALPTILTGNGSNPDAATESKMSYMKSLRLYTGRYTDAPVWKIFARPFVMFFYPCVIWAFLIYGTTLTWIVYV